MATDPEFDRRYEVARKGFPLVAKRARELRKACLEAKSVGQGLEAIRDVFGELADGELKRFPVDIVEVLYMRTFMACFDCLAAIERDMQRRGISTEPVKVLAYHAGGAFTELLYQSVEQAEAAIAELDRINEVGVNKS